MTSLRTSGIMQIYSIFSFKEKIYYPLCLRCFRDLYCSELNDDLYNCYESKENVDTSNLNGKIEEPIVNSVKDTEVCDDNDFFLLQSNNSSVTSLRNRNKGRLVSNNGVESVRTESEFMESEAVMNTNGTPITESPVWCMDFCNDLIILGCADGRIEFWEASSGKFMVIILYFVCQYCFYCKKYLDTVFDSLALYLDIYVVVRECQIYYLQFFIHHHWSRCKSELGQTSKDNNLNILNSLSVSPEPMAFNLSYAKSNAHYIICNSMYVE